MQKIMSFLLAVDQAVFNAKIDIILEECEKMEKYKGFTSGKTGDQYEIPRPFATK